jgi:hypothetical protein
MKVQNVVLTATAVAVVSGLGYIVNYLDRITNRLDQMQNQIDNIGELVHRKTKIQASKRDFECLTRNIYYEAGIESAAGKYAVANITLNRVSNGYWGNSICAVVYSKSQFSWTKIKKLPKPNAALWQECETIAQRAVDGWRVSGLERSLFYHADYIKNPKWVDQNHYIVQIGRHKFYNRAKNSWISL